MIVKSGVNNLEAKQHREDVGLPLSWEENAMPGPGLQNEELKGKLLATFSRVVWGWCLLWKSG